MSIAGTLALTLPLSIIDFGYSLVASFLQGMSIGGFETTTFSMVSSLGTSKNMAKDLALFFIVGWFPIAFNGYIGYLFLFASDYLVNLLPFSEQTLSTLRFLPLFTVCSLVLLLFSSLMLLLSVGEIPRSSSSSSSPPPNSSDVTSGLPSSPPLTDQSEGIADGDLFVSSDLFMSLSELCARDPHLLSSPHPLSSSSLSSTSTFSSSSNLEDLEDIDLS